MLSIDVDPWGGIAVHWTGADVWMLVDWTAHECWIVWRGHPIVRRATGRC